MEETKQVTQNVPDQFVLIIGAMKCGTTSLFDILSQHNQICPSKVKEPDYFVKQSNDQSNANYLGLWDWKPDVHRVALESSVAYTKAPYVPGVPENIRDSGLGKFRFIYMIRNPITRIESQVRHGLFAGWGKSLDEGITDDLINFSSYAMQIKNYLQYFPKKDIIVIPLEEFKSEPGKILKRICIFLDIDSSFQFSDVDEPRNSGAFFESSPLIARLTQGKLGSLLSRKVLPKWLKAWLRKKITNFNKAGNNTADIGRWKLTIEEKAIVLHRLADDIKALNEEFDIDVQKYWGIPTELLVQK